MSFIIGRGRYAREAYPQSPGSGGNQQIASRAWYGDGVDGALHFDGVSTVVLAGGFDLVPDGSGNYNILRDVFATTLLIDGTAKVNTAGQRVYANVSATINGAGVLHSQASAGTALDFVTLPGSYAGGPGGAAGVAGTNGSSMLDRIDAVFNPIGGAGGAGNAGTNAGGTGGTPFAALSGGGSLRQAVFSTTGGYVSVPGQSAYGGSGGGGGGGGTTGAGGTGGDGGGTLLLASPIIAGTGTLRAKGANGAAAAVGGNGGGGGGGSGGLILLTSTSPVSASLTLDTSGGAGGAGDGTGAAGSPGGSGAVIQVAA